MDAISDPDTQRVWLSNGIWCVVNPVRGTVIPVFPPSFDLNDYLLVNHHVDRGGTSVALMRVAREFIDLPFGAGRPRKIPKLQECQARSSPEIFSEYAR